MTRDALTQRSDDPANRWSAQLESLFGRRRDAVTQALRDSIDSGYPADAEGVRILVAYAQGQISARQYVAQTLESLGFLPAAHPPASRQPERWRAPEPSAWDDDLSIPPAPIPPVQSTPSRWRDPWAEPLDSLERHASPSESIQERGDGTTITQSRRTSRQEAVRAFVTGQIPVEEFLRISRTRTV